MAAVGAPSHQTWGEGDSISVDCSDCLGLDLTHAQLGVGPLTYAQLGVGPLTYAQLGVGSLHVGLDGGKRCGQGTEGILGTGL